MFPRVAASAECLPLKGRKDKQICRVSAHLMPGVQAPSSESFLDVLIFSGQGAFLGRLGGDLVLGKERIQ